jgi:hypothetical protein
MDQIDYFNAALGAMLLGLSLYALATAYGIFRSPGRRLKSLHFDRFDDGSWNFFVSARKPVPGAWSRFQEALEKQDAQEKEATQGKKVAKKAKNP